ncbi:MAG TPA: hypothetical protein VG711_05230 [Phycisphaerales bacterium]|nr:hypothetical protein [Phycisphaerales bacterium]
MPDNGINPRFQLVVNDQTLKIGGLSDQGVMSVAVSWICRPLKNRGEQSETEAVAESSGKHIQLHFSGLITEANKIINWHHSDPSVGDEITIRILPPGEFDEPQRVSEPPPCPPNDSGD